MTERFRNTSPNALTIRQAIDLEKKRMAERRRHAREARDLAAQGRGEDTEVAHLALGEMVVPRVLQTPELLDALRRAAEAHGISLKRLSVGNAANIINPNTGAPEFDLSDNNDPDRNIYGPNGEVYAQRPDWEALGQQAVNKANARFDKQIAKKVSLIGALYDPRVEAGMNLTTRAEGGAVNRWTGGQEFTPSMNHPGNRPKRRPGEEPASAAGLFQMPKGTFEDMEKLVGPLGFEEPGQKLAAVALMDHLHALEPLRNENLNGFLANASKRWAALPEGQGDKDRTNPALSDKNTAKPYASVRAWYEDYLNQAKGR